MDNLTVVLFQDKSINYYFQQTNAHVSGGPEVTKNSIIMWPSAVMKKKC